MWEFAKIDDLKPGQRVRLDKRDGFHVSSTFGAIERLTSATVWIKPDRGGDLITRRASREGRVELHVLTAHELATEEWRKLEPTTEFVQVVEDRDRRNRVVLRVRAEVRATDKPAADVLMQITNECARLTVWLDSRPIDPEGS